MTVMGKLDKMIALSQLVSVENYNKAIHKLQDERDALLDPLVKEFGSAEINKLYAQVENPEIH